MPEQSSISQLIVEGKNDKHVVWALCKQHQVPETFTVKIGGEIDDQGEDEDGGLTELLDGIPVRLKTSGLQALGMVVDADQNLQARWDAVRHRLISAGYRDMPQQPDMGGTVIVQENLPRVGVWLMPNNVLAGNLENFAIQLIRDDDRLLPKAEQVLQGIEAENLQQYPLVRHSKALIHTWLAWQEMPGRPIGQSITVHVLLHDAPLATAFVNWLRRLFEL